MPASLNQLIELFGYIELFTISASLVLFFAAQPICRWLNNDDSVSTRASMMRLLNFLIIVAVITNALEIFQSDWLGKFTQCLIVVYFAILGTQIINFFIRQRFGKVRTLKNTVSVADTYSSRGLSLIVAAVMAIIAIVSCLRILGLNSLLEAGGAIGIMGIFLAMTQAAWAPDIISGLIILNSRLCEEGDVVQFNMQGQKIVASIFRTKLFHTECLDLSNNHRLMVRNAKLRDYGLQNLSRFASAKGLRERLLFKIDYQHSQAQVTAMFERAFAAIDSEHDSRESQHEPEVLVYATGDNAVTWAVYYYIKNVRRLLYIKQIYRSFILAEAQRSNISLATPNLNINYVELEQKEHK